MRISLWVGVSVILVVSGICRSEEAAWCNIKEVEAAKLSNAVRITVKADGWLQIDTNPWDYIEQVDENFELKPVERIWLWLPNARSQVGRFVNVSIYPVSHVEIVVPPEAKGGVGLVLTVALYVPVRLRRFESDGMSWDAGPELGELGVDVRLQPDKRGLVVTVMSDRMVELPPERKKAVPEPKSGLNVECRDGLLDIHALNVDLHRLLAVIAEKSGVKLVADDAVKRLVSLNLEAVSVGEVVEGLVAGYGLAASKLSDEYVIADGTPASVSTYITGETESIPMKYVPPRVAINLLPNFLLGYVHPDIGRNAVVATASVPVLRKIKADLKKIDIPPPQIRIEALAVEFSSRADLEAVLGVRYRDGKFGAGVLGESGDISYMLPGALPKDFGLRLEALISEGRAKVWAKPHIVVLNGKKGELFVGKQKYIQIYTFWSWEPARLKVVEVGVKLEVTAWTGGGDVITIEVSPEVSNIVEVDPETRLPLVNSRRVETTVQVKDGETVVVSGLLSKEQRYRRRKIPILGDLPLIGSLFRSWVKGRADNELVVFITPRIVSGLGVSSG